MNVKTQILDIGGAIIRKNQSVMGGGEEVLISHNQERNIALINYKITFKQRLKILFGFKFVIIFFGVDNPIKQIPPMVSFVEKKKKIIKVNATEKFKKN